MADFREQFRFHAPLAGLEEMLQQVADGRLTTDEAAQQIRRLAARPRVSPKLVRGILVLIGAIFVLVALGFAAYSALFALGAKEVQGKVIEMVGGQKQAPVVEYHVDGERFVLRSTFSTSPPAFAVGDPVQLLYRPDRPQRAQLNTFVHRWLFAVVFAASGVGLMFLGFLWTFVVRLITGWK